MKTIAELVKSADWKEEKHVPVIECESRVPADTNFDVSISVGKEVDHPNTTEHHIRWIQLYFLPDGGTTPIQIAKTAFNAHGESPEGPNESSVYTHHTASVSMKTGKAGTLMALSYCNIHGLWQSSRDIDLA